jgi:hypothetical protein
MSVAIAAAVVNNVADGSITNDSTTVSVVPPATVQAPTSTPTANSDIFQPIPGIHQSKHPI